MGEREEVEVDGFFEGGFGSKVFCTFRLMCGFKSLLKPHLPKLAGPPIAAGTQPGAFPNFALRFGLIL
jgi:hypothetical protein